MDRPEKKFEIDTELESSHHGETGIVRDIDWSVSFGCWCYKLERTTRPRYSGKLDGYVWICESDLKEISK
jgi:hypothetical protein